MAEESAKAIQTDYEALVKKTEGIMDDLEKKAGLKVLRMVKKHRAEQGDPTPASANLVTKENEECKVWASEGECSANSEYMRQTCPEAQLSWLSSH